MSMSVTCLVNWTQDAGAIIGKGGANIRHLRQDVSTTGQTRQM